MKWFEEKEHSAGKKRLILTWFLYKIFGAKILYVISFLVSIFTFIFAPKIRNYSKKYLTKTEKYTNLKPNLLNEFRHILSYADSLADKIMVFAGDYDIKNIIFDSIEDKTILYNDINTNKGVFFICNHIGNIEILHSLFEDTIKNPNCKINIFISHKQSQIFNKFLNSIKKDLHVKMFPIEDIGLETGVILKENLNNGDIVFIAGDRLSETNGDKCIETSFFNSKIHLPVGTFKLAKLMEVPVYFISALKIDDKYTVYVEKQKNRTEKEIIENYTRFLEKMVLKAPLQFFHFYDFFE